MTKYNWETIKRQYVHGIKKEDGTKTYPSYADLSQQHGPTKSTISNRSSKDPDGRWEEQRERYQKKIEQKVTEKKTEIEAENIVEGDFQCESFAKKALKVATKKLNSIEVKLDEGEYVTGYDLLNTVNAAKFAQEMMKTSQDDNINKVRLEATQEVKLDITNPDFMDAELEFADKLINRRLGGTTD